MLRIATGALPQSTITYGFSVIVEELNPLKTVKTVWYMVCRTPPDRYRSTGDITVAHGFSFILEKAKQRHKQPKT